MSIRRKYQKRSRRSCNKRSKRSCKKRSKRSRKKCSKSISSQILTREFINYFILHYIPKIDGVKTFFKPKKLKKTIVGRRPSVVMGTDEEDIDTYVPVQVLNIDNIKMVPTILTDYIPIKVEENSILKSEEPIPMSDSEYSREIEKREREENEKSEKYKVRIKNEEGKYYFELIYNEPDVVYSKIKELYKDDDYIKSLNDNTLYTPGERSVLTFIYIY